MYAAGAEHPNKAPAIRLLEKVARGEIAATLDAEVLQEILHRYSALNRWSEGRRVYSLTRSLFPSVVPITSEVMDRAKQFIDSDPSLSVRDATHAAIVDLCSLDGICTFDSDFHRIPGIRVISP